MTSIDGKMKSILDTGIIVLVAPPILDLYLALPVSFPNEALGTGDLGNMQVSSLIQNVMRACHLSWKALEALEKMRLSGNFRMCCLEHHCCD